MDPSQTEPRSDPSQPDYRPLDPYVSSSLDPSQPDCRPLDPYVSSSPGPAPYLGLLPAPDTGLMPSVPALPYPLFAGQVTGQGQHFQRAVGVGDQVQGQILQPVMGMSRPWQSDVASDLHVDCPEEFAPERSMRVPSSLGQRTAVEAPCPTPPFLAVQLGQMQGQILGPCQSQILGQGEGQLVYMQPPSSGLIQQGRPLTPQQQFVQSPAGTGYPQRSLSPGGYDPFGRIVQPGVVALDELSGGGGGALAAYRLSHSQGHPPLAQGQGHHQGHNGGPQAMEGAGHQHQRFAEAEREASSQPQYYPGWIQDQLRSAQQPAVPAALTFPPRPLPPPVTLHSIGVRPRFLPQSALGGSRRAKAMEARFRSLYPAGFHKAQGPLGRSPGSKAAEGFQPVAVHSLDNAASGDAVSEAPMEVDAAGSSAQALPSEQTSMDVTLSPLRPEVKVPATSLLDLQIRTADRVRSVRDVATSFIQHTYSQFGAATYCIPHKAPVNQHHPDKALVRTREGEFRVNMALEQLSLQAEENMFILGDYHYESFLYHLGTARVDWPSQHQGADTLNQLRRDNQFGDFDFLLFHPTCGIIVVGLCSVNSNSDVQYILKRVQKSRIQLEKSAAVAKRCMAALGIYCPVIRVFCTPNLKRSFLSKVTARDKVTDRGLSTMSILCSDHLPGQFRTKWYTTKAFQALLDWWAKVKAECPKLDTQFSQEQLSMVVGCFLCPQLSKVDFEQTSPLEPSQKQAVLMDSKETTASSQSHDRDSSVSPTSGLDLSDLNLTIGNVSKPFSQFMEEYVDLYYPNLLTRTYRVPPIHFNIQKVSHMEGYDLLDMPMSKDTRGDEGENRVVSAIEMLGMKHEAVRPVFIICDFQYNNYLNKLKETMFVKGDDRRPRRAYGQSVRAQHDCLLIHRRYGIIIVSVKAVGDNFDEWASSGNEQWGAVKRTLGKVLKQLPREEKMVDMVLGDLISDLPCTKLIALPNLSRADINTAIQDDLHLQQDIEAMFPELGTRALLCKDELCDTKVSIWDQVEDNPDLLPNLCDWWDRVVGPGRPDVLSEDLYKQIIGRFCGLLSTVEVWSVQTPRVEIRSLAEAIQETAQRYARILLTQEQAAVLHDPAKFLFLSGPPGTGKTLLLTLAAQRWMSEGGHVVILNLNYGSPGLPLGHVLHRQVASMARHHGNVTHPQKREGSASPRSLSPAPSPTPTPSSSAGLGHQVERVDCDTALFDPLQPGILASIPKDSFIIADEVMSSSHRVIGWVVQSCQPRALWCAGQFQHFCPPDFQSRWLDRILRCTPMVQRVLKHIGKELGSVGTELGAEPGMDTGGAKLETGQKPDDSRGQWEHFSHNYVPSSAPWGLSTDGSRPLFIFHSQHNSPSSLPQGCQHCARELSHLFQHDLHLHLQHSGAPDQTKKGRLARGGAGAEGLSLKDVVIVSREAEPCEFSATLKRCGVALTVLTDTADPLVAFPTQEEVVFTTPFAMAGLERKVVVFVASQSKDPLLEEEEEWLQGRSKGVGVRTRSVNDLKVGQALDQLTEEDQVSLWYTASRCLSQLIVIVP